MPPIKGRQIYIGYQKDAIRNVASSTVLRYQYSQEFDLQPKKENVVDDSSFNDVETNIRDWVAKEWGEGKLKMHTYHNRIGDFFTHIYRQSPISVQDGTTGAYTHTWIKRANTSEAPTFTIQYSSGDDGIKRARGCQINEATFEFSASDNKPTVEYDIKALAIEPGDVLTPAYAQPPTPLLVSDLICTYASGAGGLGSGTQFKVMSLKVKLGNGADPEKRKESGSIFSSDILVNGVEDEIEFTLMNDSVGSQLLQRFRDGTGTAFSFDLTSLEQPFLGSSTILRRRLNFTCATSLMMIEEEKPRDDYYKIKVTIKPRYSVGDGYSLRTILQDDIATH
jgi:hypothetical protein